MDINFCWGRQGARRAAEDNAVTGIVDVLSFSTAVAVACAVGARVTPFVSSARAKEAVAAHPQLMLAVRREAAAPGDFSLSPVRFLQAKAGDWIALPSPNGATCCTIAVDNGATDVFAGSLVNATATAHALQATAVSSGRSIWVVACGERNEPQGLDDAIRFALEDYLGAGAILNGLSGRFSPDAELCRAAYQAAAAAGNIGRLLETCESGQELIARNYAGDVSLAVQTDVYHSAARLVDACFRAF
jgi:2-phosphosulfolactate phosphatase